jgi:hypothetical protein
MDNSCGGGRRSGCCCCGGGGGGSSSSSGRGHDRALDAVVHLGCGAQRITELGEEAAAPCASEAIKHRATACERGVARNSARGEGADCGLAQERGGVKGGAEAERAVEVGVGGTLRLEGVTRGDRHARSRFGIAVALEAGADEGVRGRGETVALPHL